MPDGHTYLCRRKAAKARFDNRHSTSVPAPTLAVVSGSGARGTSSPLNRQCYPPHFMRECIPPNLHDPQRAKGSLDRRSKRLSFPHFFLRRKKCGRRRPPPRQGETDSPPQRQGLFRAPARAFLLSPTAPFLPTAEEMGERTPAETAFLHFLSALRLFAAVRFPSRNRRFPDRCRSPDCASTAFRCRCPLLQ